MSKHIMLLFVSMVNLKRPAVQYSGLKCSAADDGITYTTTTNESAVYYLLDYLRRQDSELDRLFCFSSDSVQQRLAGTEGTHLDYFSSRLKLYIANIEERLQVVKYDENLPANAALPLVLEMAQQLTEYRAANQSEEIILHVDLTGGMRYASMLMLGIMRLLEYNGVKIGKILYSNYRAGKLSQVEESDEIYKLFDLISGAEEFVRFGSVESVLSYYEGRKQEPELKRLLAAMKNFSEQVKLCHYGDLKSAISELREAERVFKQTSGNQNTALFKQLIGTLEKEYQTLFCADFDDVDLIKWCIEKDNIQQALTLYTERIPEYINTNIIDLGTEIKQSIYNLESKDKLNREAGFLFMNEYKLPTDYIKDEEERKCYLAYEGEIKELETAVCQEITAMLKESLTKNISEIECWQRLDKVLGEVKYSVNFYGRDNVYQLLADWQAVKDNVQILKSYPVAKPNLQRLIESYLKKEAVSNMNPNNRYLALKFGGQRYSKCLEPYITSQFDSNTVVNICNFKLEKIKPNYEKLKMLLKYGLITTKISLDMLNQLYDDYSWVKAERIHSNHAKKEKAAMSNAELKKKLSEFLKRLEAAKEACLND